MEKKKVKITEVRDAVKVIENANRRDLDSEIRKLPVIKRQELIGSLGIRSPYNKWKEQVDKTGFISGYSPGIQGFMCIKLDSITSIEFLALNNARNKVDTIIVHTVGAAYKFITSTPDGKAIYDYLVSKFNLVTDNISILDNGLLAVTRRLHNSNIGSIDDYVDATKYYKQ